MISRTEADIGLLRVRDSKAQCTIIVLCRIRINVLNLIGSSMIRAISLGCFMLVCAPVWLHAQNPPHTPSAPPLVVTPTARTAVQDSAAAMGKAVTNAYKANSIKNYA